MINVSRSTCPTGCAPIPSGMAEPRDPIMVVVKHANARPVTSRSRTSSFSDLTSIGRWGQGYGNWEPSSNAVGSFPVPGAPTESAPPATNQPSVLGSISNITHDLANIFGKPDITDSRSASVSQGSYIDMSAPKKGLSPMAWAGIAIGAVLLTFGIYKMVKR